MSSPNVKAPAFITTLNGKRCTAVPKNNGGGGNNNNNNGGNAQIQTAANVAATTQQQAAKVTLAAAADTTSTASTTNLILSLEALSTAAPAQLSIAQFTQVFLEPPAVTEVASSSSTTAAAAIATAPASITQIASIAQIPQQAQNPASAAESSQTDDNTVPIIGKVGETGSVAALGEPAPAPTNAPPSPAETPAQSSPESPASPPGTEPTPALLTTIGFASGTAAGDAAAATSGSVAPAISLVPQQQASGPPTVIIATSVAGGVAVVAIAALLFWLWRSRLRKKRRSTLLTPLDTDPRNFGASRATRDLANEKGNYTIDRASLGPTPRSEKMKAALGYSFKRLRGNLSVAFSNKSGSGPGVNMNRGNSQFLDSTSMMNQHARSGSGLSASGSSKAGEPTSKDRFFDWFGRLRSDAKFNWRVRNDVNASSDPFAAARDIKEKNAAAGKRPDFLTLLGMNDGEVDREAQRRRLSRSGSAGSHFLGGLGLNFESSSSADPFSDANAIRPHDSAKVAPLQMGGIPPLQLGRENPFSDANAITGPLGGSNKAPTNYVANVRRSRGQSAGAGGRPSSSGGNGGTGVTAGFLTRGDSVYNRESVNSVESFGTRRNKFRSDPFDLDRPELLANRQNVTSSNFSTAGDSTAPRLSSNTSGSGLPVVGGPPRRAHMRGDSFTSKYSSGVSMGDWSDPGPDVGPAATRWDSPTDGYRRGERVRRSSGGSQSSVGKAL